jgi:hypothetical protein
MAYGHIVCGLTYQELWESGRGLIQIGIYSRTQEPVCAPRAVNMACL